MTHKKERPRPAAPRPELLPASMRGGAGQAKPQASGPRAPRPELLPVALRGAIGQPKREAGTDSCWRGAPRPELLPIPRAPGAQRTAQAQADRFGRRVAPKVGARTSTPPRARVIQPSMRSMSKFGALLVDVCKSIDTVLVINNMVDDDCKSLGETSQGFYESQPFKVAKRVLSWDDEAQQIIGDTKLLFNLKKQRVLVVVTSHGNVHWLFGTVPDGEDDAAAAFALALGGLQETLGCTFAGVVLDACWSGTEVHESQAAIVAPCSARTLSRAVPVPVFGFDGKASSGTVSYYDENKKKTTKSYADGCRLFIKGELASRSGKDEIWHSGEYLQKKSYYGELFHVRPGSDGYFRSQ